MAASAPIEIAWFPGEDRGQRSQRERERDHEERRHDREDEGVLDRVGDDVPDRCMFRSLCDPDR
jgi:hypothetical protein